MASQITATLPTLDFPLEADYPTQEDWAAFSAAAELNFGILGGSWSEQMQLWKDQANDMSIELNNNADIVQSVGNYQGDWISQGYALGQTVSVSGIYYVCKLTHATGQNPTDIDSLYWNLVIGNWNLKADKTEVALKADKTEVALKVDKNMSAYTTKTTPVDADLFPLSDSDLSFGIKKLTWANLKATLVTYLSTGTGFSVSLLQNGYIRFPTWLGGLIIQWGLSNVANSSGTVTFPISFLNECFQVLATYKNNNTAAASVNTHTYTTTGFSFSKSQSSWSFIWVSIGR